MADNEVQVITEGGAKEVDKTLSPKKNLPESPTKPLSGTGETMEDRVLSQIEYYFGDNNFPRDKFLKTESAKDNGWVEIKTLLTFNRLKKIVETLPEEEHAKKIAEVLKASTLVDVDDSMTKLRRNPDVAMDANSEARTVYFKGFSRTETQLDHLLEFFKKYEGVEAVIMRWYKEKSLETGSTGEAEVNWLKKFKGSILVVMKTVEQATNLLKEDIEFKGQKISTKMFLGDYKKMKREEMLTRIEARKKKAGGEANGSSKDGKESKNGKSDEAKDELEGANEKEVEAAKEGIVKGALIKLTNIPNTISREDFKSSWYEATIDEEAFKVVFVDFNKGATEGIVRLGKEGSAEGAVKLLPGGKLKVGEDSYVDVTVMEGDEEQAYLDGITAKRMQLKRGPPKGGRGRGRGRGGGGGKRRRY